MEQKLRVNLNEQSKKSVENIANALKNRGFKEQKRGELPSILVDFALSKLTKKDVSEFIEDQTPAKFLIENVASIEDLEEIKRMLLKKEKAKK